MAQKLITFLPEADRKYKSDTLSSILSASSVNRILANPNDRTLWINGWPFGHTFVSQNAAKPQPTNAEVFNFYTQFDANGNVIEGNAAYGNYSNAFGFNTVANNDFETAIGSLNYSIPSDYTAAKTSIFTIGIGDPSNYATMLNDAEYIPGATIPKDNNAYRKNALLVTKDGSIYLKNTSEIINSKNVEYTPCGYSGGPLTGNEKSLQRIVSDTMKLKAVTYAELISLRSLGQLVPGMKYRITDFATTVLQDANETQAAHIKAATTLFAYDIIVEAISETKLSKLARATYPSKRANGKATDALHEWQLWYDVDNNKDVFPWADDRVQLSYFTVQHTNNTPLFHSETSYGGADLVGSIITQYGDDYIENFLRPASNASSWFKSDIETNTLNETRATAIKTYRDFIYYDNYEYIHTYNDADGIARNITYTQRWLPCTNTQDAASNAGGDAYLINNNREASAVDYYCALTEFLEPKDKSAGFKNILICLNETTKQLNSTEDKGVDASQLVDNSDPANGGYDLTTLGEYEGSGVDLSSSKTMNEQTIQVEYRLLAPDRLKVRLLIDAPYTSYEPSNDNPATFDNIEVEERYYLYAGKYYGSKFNQGNSNTTKSLYKWIRTDANFSSDCKIFGSAVKLLDENNSTIYRKPEYIPEGIVYEKLITNENQEYMVTEGLYYDGSPTFDWEYEGGRTPYPGTRIYGSYLESNAAKRIKSSDILYVNGEDSRPEDYLGAIAYTKYDQTNGREYYFSFALNEGSGEIPYMLDTNNIFEYNDTTYMMWINTNNSVEASDTTPIIITSPGADLDTLAELKYCNDDNIASALLKINFDDDGEYGSWLLYQDIKLKEVSETIYHCSNSAYSVIRLPRTIVEREFDGYIPATILGNGHNGYNFVRLYDKYTYKQSDYCQWLFSYNNGQSFDGPIKTDEQEAGIIADILTSGSSLVAKTISKEKEGYTNCHDYVTFYYEPDNFKVLRHTYIIPLCKALPVPNTYTDTKYHGTGVITRMIDEHGNDCPYDFKNILLENSNAYYYTFSSTAGYDGSVQDASLLENCKNNVIKFSSLKTFPKTIFNSTSFEDVVFEDHDRGQIGGELPEPGTEVPDGENTETENTEEDTKTVLVSSDIMNNTIINCDNLVISNNCISSTFSNVTDTNIKREVYNSMFKNISLGDDDPDISRNNPYYCAYYNGASNIINGVEASVNTRTNGSQVKTTMFSDDQVLFSGDNLVMFTKASEIKTSTELKNYVGNSIKKSIAAKSISVSKREPSTGTRNWESLSTTYGMSNAVTLFDFSSLGEGYSLQTDSDSKYSNQKFFGGYFVLDVGYRYENKWLCNHVVSRTKMTLELKKGTSTSNIHSSIADSGNATMPWDKSDHTTGMRLFWRVPDTTAFINSINTAISEGETIKLKLTSGSFSMSTNSNSCYAITINNFAFIPAGNSKLDEFKNSDGTPRDSGVIFGYSGASSGTSTVGIETTTSSGSAVIICGNGVVVTNGKNATLLKAGGNGIETWNL